MSYHADAMDLDVPTLDLPSINYIDTLPCAVFVKIVSYLEPIWLYNLSHTNGHMRRMLSFEEGGNRIWYDAMPQGIWHEKEKFQDEIELEDLALSHYEAGTLNADYRLWIHAVVHRREVEEFVSMQRLHMNIFFPHQPWLPYRGAAIGSPSFYQAPGQLMSTHANRLAYQHASYDGAGDHHGAVNASLDHFQPVILPSSKSLRPMIKTLGSPYQHLFNYKREILERIKHRTRRDKIHKIRCQVCLRKNSDMFHFYSKQHWGVIWCPTCFDEYTISYHEIATVMGNDELCYHADMLSFRSGHTFTYYRPGLENVLFMKQWPSFDTMVKLNKQFQAKYHKQVMSGSLLEKRRREVRCEIARYAQLLWDGIDPCPEVSVVNGVVTSNPDPDFEDPGRYQCFRERFCPTAKLPEMLFPAWRMSGNADDGAFEGDGGWLNDLTKQMVLQRCLDRKEFPPTTYRAMASKMLILLTMVGDEAYNSKGHGGFVKAWVEAARQYHMDRIETQIQTGLIVRMGHIPMHRQHASMYHRFHKLRAKVGLEDASGYFVYPALNRPTLYERLHGDLAAVMKQDADAVALHREHRQKIDTFNTIIRRNCSVCPSGSGLFYPKGLDSMLVHLRRSHPALFWRTDDFTIVG
ncbi:MAG: hypothetical protein MMC23_002532 [Stictis urceolatum]|nr:hypothetical protein [Stictis urceolata]